MGRIIGIIRYDGKATDEATILKMGARLHNVSPSMIYCHKNLSLGVFEWKDKKKNICNNSKDVSSYADADGCIVIDGRIYHLDEKDQKRYGSLDEHSSAELLYKTYRSEGIQQIFRYNSSFTSVIFDAKKDELIISKDRLGFVPLFVYKDKDKMIFSSEIKAILEHPEAKVTPNLEAIGLYSFYHYRYAYDHNMTFFSEISYFPPAKTTTISLKSGREKTSDSWTFEYKPRDMTEKEAKKELLRLTEKALRERMDPVKGKKGFFMSGGVDSPVVVALGCKRLKGKDDRADAFSVYYPEETGKGGAGDEYYYIKKILDMYKEKIRWHPVTPKGDELLKYLPELIERYEQPIVTVTAYSFYTLCKQAHDQGFSLLFTGDGPDHLMAGIYDHFYYFFADLKAKGEEKLLDREVSWWIKYHDHPVFKKSKDVLQKYFDRCIDFTEPGKIKGYSWYQPEVAGRYLEIKNKDFPVIDIKELPIAPSPTSSYLVNSLYQYIYHTGSHCASWFEDIASATFGIEGRSIFFMKEIHEFCWNMPGRLMIKDGKFKHLFREAMHDLLPSEVIDNPNKSGFNAPSNLWFKDQLYRPFKEMITGESFLSGQIYDKEKLLAVLEDHVQGKANHMMFLWNAFSTELWLRRYFPNFRIENDKSYKRNYPSKNAGKKVARK